MKILLVNPQAPDTFWSMKRALKFISKKSVLPPLGLLTVAGILPESWDLRLVDMATTPICDDDIRWADYVFVTAMLIQRTSVDEVIERCNGLGTKVVAGGPLFTSMPEQYEQVDHLVLKEAECTLPAFIADIQAGRARKVYNTHEKADLHHSPIPRWDLIDLRDYAHACVQYTRGCPFDCDFCDVTTLFGHKMRTKDTAQVLDELDRLYELGWRNEVFFVDDNFIGNKTKLKTELLPALAEWTESRDYPFTFYTQASINLADDEELMEMMVRAGFNNVFIGIETPSEEGLAECNKIQNRGRDMVQCVRKIQRSGIQVRAGFILGFDSDDGSVFTSLIDFIQESGIVMAMVGLLNAPRGTRLFERLLREQRLTRISTGDNADGSINFIPKMGMENLVAGYDKVIRTIYSPKVYCRRVRRFLHDYEASQIAKVNLRFPGLSPLLKSMWYIGVLEKGRWHYWSLLLWASRRRDWFHMAVMFSICGYHFRQTFRAIEQRRSIC